LIHQRYFLEAGVPIGADWDPTKLSFYDFVSISYIKSAEGSRSDADSQGSAIPRRQGRQRCPQYADSEGGPPEEVCTKEIRGAEVNVLSQCGRAGTAATALKERVRI
jgi:hypothetical protein